MVNIFKNRYIATLGLIIKLLIIPRNSPSVSPDDKLLDQQHHKLRNKPKEDLFLQIHNICCCFSCNLKDSRCLWDTHGYRHYPIKNNESNGVRALDVAEKEWPKWSQFATLLLFLIKPHLNWFFLFHFLKPLLAYLKPAMDLYIRKLRNSVDWTPANLRTKAINRRLFSRGCEATWQIACPSPWIFSFSSP